MRNAARLAVLVALLAACGKDAPGNAPSRYYVLKGGQRVQWIEDKPGSLGSQAAPPAGGKAATGYLTARSFNAFEEGALRQAYDKAASFEEYVALLKKSGYTLEVTTDTP
jgi:hypothetical protein